MAVVETQIRQAMSRMLVIPCGGSTAGEAHHGDSGYHSFSMLKAMVSPPLLMVKKSEIIDSHRI